MAWPTVMPRSISGRIANAMLRRNRLNPGPAKVGCLSDWSPLGASVPASEARGAAVVACPVAPIGILGERASSAASSERR
jgi:hypothetical protein